MSIQSRWSMHAAESGRKTSPGQDVTRPVDARRCTVQLSSGHLYLDVVASPETALLGYDLPLMPAADAPEVSRLLSSLAPGYFCVTVMPNFAAAAEFAKRICRTATGTHDRVVEWNALDGEPVMSDAVLIAHENETLGRTGRWLASACWGRGPDLVVVGEALALGFPFGAVLKREGFEGDAQLGSIWREVPEDANSTSLARVKAAIATVENEGLIQHGLGVANYLMARLSAMRETCAQIERIEATGLSIRVAFAPPLSAAQIRRKMCERGVLAGLDRAGRLAIDPPLPLRIAEADVITGALRSAILDLPLISPPGPCAACADGN